MTYIEAKLDSYGQDDYKTYNKYFEGYFGLNDYTDNYGITLWDKISGNEERKRLSKERYRRSKTLGVGSHAEVNALNEALLSRPDASLDDFMVYVVRSGKKLKPLGLPIPRCSHCKYITKGK